jgi:chemotaxis receptor (MCP) glutamine deamidase CheD
VGWAGNRLKSVSLTVVADDTGEERIRNLFAKVQDIDDPSLRVKRVTTSMTQY